MGGAKTVIVAGVGFRHGVVADEIVALVARALGEVALSLDRLSALATVEARSAEPGFREAARRLAVPARSMTADALAATPAGRTASNRVQALYGVGSVAEAAALACAGQGAELLAPRITSARATCAIARGRAP